MNVFGFFFFFFTKIFLNLQQQPSSTEETQMGVSLCAEFFLFHLSFLFYKLGIY